MPKWKRQPPPLKDPLRLAIAKRLAPEAKALNGFTPLAQAITDNYVAHLSAPWRPQGKYMIAADKLSRLARFDRSVTMSIVEWEALDLYFDHELTKCSLFEFPSLVQDLAQCSEAGVLIPSRFSKVDGPMTNYWDNHGVAEIQRAMNRHGPAVKFNQIYVQRRPETPGTTFFGKWKQQFRIKSKKGPDALACVGSPRANRGSEFALRLMFRRPKKKRTGWDALPFTFGYLDDEENTVESNFCRPPDELKQTHPDLAAYIAAKKGWVLVAGKDSFKSQAPIPPSGGAGTRGLRTKIRSYGVLAVQRQEGQLVLVVAGLTAPGSLVAATGLDMMTTNLPQPGDPFEHAVLWGVVEATVNTTGMWDGGSHELEDLCFVIQPKLWDPVARCPVTDKAIEEARKTKRSSGKDAAMGGASA